MKKVETQIKFWDEVSDGQTLVHRWRCLRCGIEGAWVHMGQTVEGVPGGHLCLEDVKRQMQSTEPLADYLNIRLVPSAASLPAGTIVAVGDLAWIKDEVDGWTGIAWSELPDEQINEMITSGEAKMLRIGNKG